MQLTVLRGILSANLPRATVLRPVLRPYFATLLLLCLGRTLLPEAWVLALHAHQHTAEAAAHRQGQELASPHHTHCHIEQFYNVAYAAAVPVAVPEPRRQPCYQALVVALPRTCPAVALRRTALRGPPRG